MPISELCHSWNHFVNRLHPEERVTRKHNFVWPLVGLYQSRSVQLNKIVEKIPVLICLPSRVRRIQRFLDNRAVRVRNWYGLEIGVYLQP